MRHLQFSKAYYTETALLPPPHTPLHTNIPFQLQYPWQNSLADSMDTCYPKRRNKDNTTVKEMVQLFLLIFFTCCASNVCISSPLCSIFVIFRLAVQAQVAHAVVSKLVAAPKLVSGIYLSKCKGCSPLHFLKWFPVLLV